MKKNVFYLLVLMLLISIKGFAVDYTFKSHAEIQDFYNNFNAAGGRIAVDNLYVTGDDVTQNDINALESCFSSIEKKLTFENLTLPSDDNNDDAGVRHLDSFLANVTQNGGIVFRNIPGLSWGGAGFIGAGLIPKHVKGDLILDFIPIPFPGVDGWATNESFGDIEQVDGDLIIGSRYSLQKFDDDCFQQLQRVGGSFRLYMTGSSSIWDIAAPKLTYIGGDFEMRGPDGGQVDGSDIAVWSLIILQNVQYIGGDVTIVNFPHIQIGQSGDWGGTGYCFIRYLIDTGVINYACHNVTLGWEDEPIDLAALGACLWGDGDNQDDPPADLPAKDPTCSSTGIKTVEPVNFATVQPTYVKDNLNIESATGLAKVEIIDILGRPVKTFLDIAAGQKSLPLSSLSSGIYMVRAINVNNEVQTVKIIKQ